MHKGENGIVELVTVRLKGMGRLEREEFCRRLTQLRMNKGVSARDMSLSIGQSAGYINALENPSYINHIENNKNFPTMENFFYICDYLEITPGEFFDTDSTNPTKASKLLELAKSLPDDQLDLLIALTKALKKS